MLVSTMSKALRISTTATILGLCTTFPGSVDAHGYMSNPSVVFQDPPNKNAAAVFMPGTPGPYNGNDVLRDLASRAGSTCGKTSAGSVQPIPSDNAVSFTITAKHIGPCELWLDNQKVASAKDCWTQYPNYKIPVDFSRCRSGQCQVRWIWVATHTSPWEIYDNCATVGGNGGGGGGGNSNTPASPNMAAGRAPAPASH